MRLATRMEGIGTETAFEAAARARALEAQGISVVHLEIGEPDFDTPPAVRAAAARALEAGKTHYAPYAGIPELRAAIAADASARKGFAVSPEHVFVTVGGKGVMLYAIEALVDPGDEVLVPDPGYPIYELLVRFMGGIPVPVPIRAANGFRLDLAELARLVTPRTRLLVLNSPANPTGGVLPRADLEAIAALAAQHDLVVLADEIYGRILYAGEHVSIAALPGMAERTIVLDGFSKTYAMTGWRLGYAIVPEWLTFAFGRLLINSVSCVATFAQWGALEALTGSQAPVDAMVAEFRARRDRSWSRSQRHPGHHAACAPTGPSTSSPTCRARGLTGADFANRLLYEAGVSVLAGTAFGSVGTDHIRLSYATSQATIATALERIRSFVGTLAVPA